MASKLPFNKISLNPLDGFSSVSTSRQETSMAGSQNDSCMEACVECMKACRTIAEHCRDMPDKAQCVQSCL